MAEILIISLVVRVTKNGAKTLDCARQGQSHVNYAKFLSFYFKQQLLKYLVLYTFFCGMIWMDILEPSDSDTVELGESWIKFNGRRSKIWNWNGSASFNDKCLLKSRERIVK